MKKIGLIDLHIDEWHANHYPAWFRAAPAFDGFEFGGAWEDSPAPQGKTLADWCEEMRIPAVSDLEKLVETCDAFCVLAPSNPEVHERLADLPLRSGKPTFIDKPFAVDKAAAERMFALADRYHTPLFSSSSLRFSDEMSAFLKESPFPVEFMGTVGGDGKFGEYCIHQIEMIVEVMGTGVTHLMHEKSANAHHVVFKFSGGRCAAMTLGSGIDFSFFMLGGGKGRTIFKTSNKFPNQCNMMLEFFKTGIPPVDPQETITIAHLVDLGIRSEKTPGVWVSVNK